MNLVSLPSFLGVKESIEIIFRVKKVAGKDEFQDRRQNGRRALSASLSRFIIELGTVQQCRNYLYDKS